MKKARLKRIIKLLSITLLISSGVAISSGNYNVNAAKRTRTYKIFWPNNRRTRKSRVNRQRHKRITHKHQQHLKQERNHRRHRQLKSRFMNYRFVTQKGRGNANDACEAASLLMALHHFGLAKHKNLMAFVKTIPRSWNPERGYTRDPYRLGTGASLYPKALLRVAKRYGAKRSYIIDDYYPYRRHGNRLYRRKASANTFIKAVLKGYPVVFEGGNRMQYGGRTRKWGHRGYRSDHVLLLYGYKNHRFYWTDPDHKHNRPGSTRIRLFMYIINAPVRGPRAVAIGK